MFDDTPDTAAIICRHIVHEGKPILFVSHEEEDGMWQFMCGGTHEIEDAMVVSLKEAYDFDHSIGVLSKMPCGYYAERETEDSEWIIRKDCSPRE